MWDRRFYHGWPPLEWDHYVVDRWGGHWQLIAMDGGDAFMILIGREPEKLGCVKCRSEFPAELQFCPWCGDRKQPWPDYEAQNREEEPVA